MITLFHSFAFFVTICVPITANLLSQETITYELLYILSDPECVHVNMTLSGDLQGPLTVVIPRSVPDAYDLPQMYDNFVENLVAFTEEGRAIVPVKDPYGPRWQFGNATFDGFITSVQYKINLTLMENTLTSSWDTSKVRIEQQYVGILGISVFMYVDTLLDEPINLMVKAPENWNAFTTLNPKYPADQGYTTGSAPNYYNLADSQIILGNFNLQQVSYTANLNVTLPALYVAIYSEGEMDFELVGKISGEGMQSVLEYFQDAPFDHYTVYLESLRPINPQADYGFNIEHLESVTMGQLYTDALLSNATSDQINRALYNTIHHMGHAWIPKRCYGDGFFPFSWEVVPVIDSIWFAEGFPQYLAVVMTAEWVSDPQEYISCMLEARFNSSLQEAPQFIQNMDTIYLSRVSSLQYSTDFRTGMNSFARGGLMAYEIDQLISQETNNAKTLRDAILALVEWTRVNQKAWQIDELPGIFQNATGVDVSGVMNKWLQPVNYLGASHRTTKPNFGGCLF